MSEQSFLSESSRKALGTFLATYVKNEPPTLILPKVAEESHVTKALRELIDRDNVARKREHYDELYRTAKNFVESYEANDLIRR